MPQCLSPPNVMELPLFRSSSIESEQEVVEAVMSEASNTRLLLIDHVTSQTGMILPIKPIIDQLANRSIDTLVDGSCRNASVEYQLRPPTTRAIATSGSRPESFSIPAGQARFMQPLTISHGANSPRTDRTRFLIEFSLGETRGQVPRDCTLYRIYG